MSDQNDEVVKRWYVIHAYSGFEDYVVRSLLDRAVQIDPEHEGVTEFRDKVAAEMSQA